MHKDIFSEDKIYPKKMKTFVLNKGYAVRAATNMETRNGLYKIDQRSIISVVIDTPPPQLFPTAKKHTSLYTF